MRNLLALLAMVCIPAVATALPVVDLGFDPSEVCPGNPVQFFFSLENQGDAASDVTLSVTFHINGQDFGPFEGVVPMAAGQVISQEIPLFVPPNVPAGTLGVTVVARDLTGESTDTGTLTILDCGGLRAATPSVAGLVNNFKKALGQIGVR